MFDDATLSYRELDQRANQLAHHLRALGAGPETIVALCVERSFDMVIALLAILKAGAAYLPLDPDYPEERLAYMLADAAAPLLVTQAALRERLPAHHARIVDLDADRAIIAQPTRQRPARPHRPATPPPTSSTPRAPPDSPKASPSHMAGLANHMRWMAHDYPAGEGDIVLGRTAISFDAAQWEIWLPLVTGAALCIAPTATVARSRQARRADCAAPASRWRSSCPRCSIR